jgi:uncharacterized membrane protein (DUF106 family)
MEKSAKEGSMKTFFIVMLVSLAIASLWEPVPIIKNTVHAILNPSAGALLSWNLTGGFLILILIVSFLTVIIQKYTTDQDTLKEMRKEQKILQEEMKKYRDNPQKMMELNKKSMEFIPKTMKLTTRSIAYTAIPLILLFRWFMDIFVELGNPKFFNFFSWFWFYLISFMVLSSVIKKILKVV